MLFSPEQIRKILFTGRLPMRDEIAMQMILAGRLAACGITYKREFPLPDGAGRIDFTVESSAGLLGIECKTLCSGMALARQLGKYGRTGKFAALVVVISRPVSIPIAHVEHEGRQIPIIVWEVPAL